MSIETDAKYKITTQKGRAEMIERANKLRRHKYTDEEIALDLGLTLEDFEALENGYIFVDSLDSLI